MLKIKKTFIKHKKLSKKINCGEKKSENFNKLSKYVLQKILKLAQMIDDENIQKIRNINKLCEISSRSKHVQNILRS